MVTHYAISLLEEGKEGKLTPCTFTFLIWQKTASYCPSNLAPSFKSPYSNNDLVTLFVSSLPFLLLFPSFFENDLILKKILISMPISKS